MLNISIQNHSSITTIVLTNRTMTENTEDLEAADVVLLLFLVLLSVLTVACNLLVMFAIVCDKRLRKRQSNYLIFSLSLSDLLTGLLVMPVLILIIFFKYFVISCEFVYVVESVVNISSIYNVFCISIDRYLNIVSFRYSVRRGIKRIIIMITVSWVTPFAAILLPKLVYYGTYYDTLPDPSACRLYLNVVYVNIRLAINYYIPFGAIIIMNIHIYYVGRRSIRKHSGVSTVSQTLSTSTTCSSTAGFDLNRGRSENKLRKTVVLIIAAFMICWCPFIIYVYVIEPKFLPQRILLAFHLLYWFALSNSMFNAVIYSFSIPEVIEFARKAFCINT